MRKTNIICLFLLITPKIEKNVFFFFLQPHLSLLFASCCSINLVSLFRFVCTYSIYYTFHITNKIYNCCQKYILRFKNIMINIHHNISYNNAHDYNTFLSYARFYFLHVYTKAHFVYSTKLRLG